VLAPRTSSTLVATWSWPTWVVESETCVKNRVHHVGLSISFENNFYRLPFTPSSLVFRFGPSLPMLITHDNRSPTGWGRAGRSCPK
jgi:hypothetical protein